MAACLFLYYSSVPKNIEIQFEKILASYLFLFPSELGFQIMEAICYEVLKNLVFRSKKLNFDQNI